MSYELSLFVPQPDFHKLNHNHSYSLAKIQVDWHTANVSFLKNFLQSFHVEIAFVSKLSTLMKYYSALFLFLNSQKKLFPCYQTTASFQSFILKLVNKSLGKIRECVLVYSLPGH